MEFWVVAAATGAGYVAKHWQNLSGEKDNSSKHSPLPSPRLQQDARQLFDKMSNPVSPLPKLARRCFLDEDVSGSTLPSIENQLAQDHTEEINGKQDKFRMKNMNRKSFSRLKPLVVTGNNKILTEHQIVMMEENSACMDTELFEPIGSMKLPIRPKQNCNTGNDIVNLFLGVTIGILSTTVSNQREVEHLSDLLEQAESMVRDLHDKLEKKDGFTTKKVYSDVDGDAIDSPKGEKFEVTSEIEAELEAELERLEENMKSCTLQRLANVVEIDSDFEADMARGDLNLDTINWQLDTDTQSESDSRGETVKSTKTETPNNNPIFTPNYAVSSLDLKLRLHQLIEHNLHARIKELESLLKDQNTQTTPHPQPDPQEENSLWDFDHTRFDSFSSTP